MKTIEICGKRYQIDCNALTYKTIVANLTQIF